MVYVTFAKQQLLLAKKLFVGTSIQAFWFTECAMMMAIIYVVYSIDPNRTLFNLEVSFVQKEICKMF